MQLGSTYLGFELANPIIVGASPLCDDPSQARRLEDAGASMLVMRSIFQEQLDTGAGPDCEAPVQCSYADAPAFVNESVDFHFDPDGYLEQIDKLKRAVRIPIVASLNGRAPGRWTDFARLIAQAGADALELNIYDPALGLEISSEQIERDRLETIAAVRAAIHIPLALKLSRTYTALPCFARQAVRAGANALVVFNRLYQHVIGIDQLDLQPEIRLSSSAELPVRLRAVAALAGRVRCDLAITGGVHTADDVIRATLVGAHAVQMVSALLRHGPDHIRNVLAELTRWLESRGLNSLSQARGSMSLMRTPGLRAMERRSYMNVLNAWKE